MIKVTMILDNWIASSLSPLEFVRTYYITERAEKDLVLIKVEQGNKELLQNGKDKDS